MNLVEQLTDCPEACRRCEIQAVRRDKNEPLCHDATFFSSGKVNDPMIKASTDVVRCKTGEVCPKVVLKHDLKHLDERLLKETRSHLKELAGDFGCFRGTNKSEAFHAHQPID
jgi:hypothetical protein